MFHRGDDMVSLFLQFCLISVYKYGSVTSIFFGSVIDTEHVRGSKIYMYLSICMFDLFLSLIKTCMMYRLLSY